MAAVTISKDDIQAHLPGTPDDVAERFIKGTIARAALYAPCIKSAEFPDEKSDAAKDILIDVIIRAIEAGSGVVGSVMAGPFQTSLDTSKPRRRRFESDEIRELKALCGIKSGGAFTITPVYDATDALAEDVTPE
ncbi:hypothetical protein [Mycobacteroides abscessus]|uniref:hypothetical protein n=1 Tax=Mycobacteroides abscessus TaxID=36809 RepID=UPI0009291B5D|nr:hypothetical protein [Mycobacteroides abscessus]DAZ90345.1 TPA_asm: head-to-tail adaptor [Mycobacterium phage prophiFSQJ01-1]SII41300.1 Uncharacterised protein [Mycobacteroides abscessus subsp. abscessus]SIK13873.1 Uncharacterised protein [Mycobacteroides abscessus subsp. abscessus]SIN25569.1 Uncharacterised protein [Mycobacteroides abscessus subsp. abscessus]SLI51348.1 Uncharacterised protein [Mycobacteroides abscessus subsp. abscessus]